MMQATTIPIPRRILARATLAVLIALTALVGALVPRRTSHAALIVGYVDLAATRTGQTYTITASGAYIDVPSALDVLVHDATDGRAQYGTNGCPHTFQAENAQVKRQMRQQETEGAAVLIGGQILGRGYANSGSFSEPLPWGAGVPAGIYWVCAYLLAPHHPGGAPSDPPEDTASLRLTIGSGPHPTPGQPSRVRITAFYTLATALSLDPSGPAPSRVTTYRFGVKIVNIYFRFSGARDGLHWTYDLITPTATGAIGSGPAISFQTGKTSGVVLDDIYTRDKRPFPPGTYRLSLMVGGAAMATTTFSIVR